RGRAPSFINSELGPETEIERLQKRFNEVGQERFTALDRSLIARARQGIVAVKAGEARDRLQQALSMGRLKTLERLGLAQERMRGGWRLHPRLESKLRR